MTGKTSNNKLPGPNRNLKVSFNSGPLPECPEMSAVLKFPAPPANRPSEESASWRSEINALWARVRVLQRKLARELAAYPAGPAEPGPLPPLVRRPVRPEAPARNPALHPPGNRRRLPAPPIGRGQQLPAGLSSQKTTPDPEALLNVILPSAGNIRPAGSLG